MELHVLGPAFGLPSIDAECAAAVALLKSRLGEEGTVWKIIPTHHTQTPLPSLYDGSDHICGFDNIAKHVAETSSAPGNSLSATQCADSLAISTFLSSNGPTLLAISLYVSFDNYRNITRPAFTQILPLHANYIIPPRRRAAARALTEHLGISSIDVDNVHEDMSNRPSGFDAGKDPNQSFETEAKGRASLLLPRKDTLRSLLQRPERAAIFKLQNLADNFFEPLQEMLAGQDFFLGGDEPSAVDFLVYGYLALMLFPKLPQDWLAKTVHLKYKSLVSYTERLHSRLKLQTNAADVMSLVKCHSEEDVQGRRKAHDMQLPWSSPAKSTVVGATKMVTAEIASHLPLLAPRAQVVPLQEPQQTFWQIYLPAFAATTFASVLLGGYYALHTGMLLWPHGEAVQIFGRKRLSDFGHLGTALAGVSLLGQQASRDSAYHQQKAADMPVHVEVAVEGDQVP